MSRRPKTAVLVAPVLATKRIWTRKFDPRLYENPEGKMGNFDFGLLKKMSKGVPNTAEAFVRSKLRHEEGPLDEATFRRDAVGNAFLLSPACPDLIARPGLFWPALDSDVWTDDQHLAIAVTLWFPQTSSQHLAMRAATSFAQTNLADKRGLCVQVVAHAPHRIGLGGDFHVHLVVSARTAVVGGLGKFARDLLGHGGQSLLYAEWVSFLAALAPAIRV